MALSRRVAPGCILALLLISPTVTAAQGARGTPTPGLPTPPPPSAQEIGPLEKRATPITPENPVPRRIHFVVPAYPLEAAGGGFIVTLTLKVTLNQQGAVAEARQTAVAVGGAGTAWSPQLLQAFRKSGIDAVRQWQYDPPITAPISLYVALTFVPDVETSVAWHDASPPPLRPDVVGGVVGGVASGVRAGPPQPPPPPPPPGAVRVGGSVMAPRKIKDVKPVYPAIAQSARVSGIVIIEAIIGTDGHVVDAHVIRSIPLLDQAAGDAVRQWEFTPTLLNGVPTQIVMSVTVNFQLDK